MQDNRAAAYRLGYITLLILAVLTLVEFVVAIYLGSAILLLLIALVKAAIIVQNFMHITRLWREESH
jgi:cytochrome c oxidase subunit IV